MHAPSKVIASIFALSAFVVATLSGLLAGATATATLLRAIPLMLIFYLVGCVVGWSIESIARGVRATGGTYPGVGGKPVENPATADKDSA